MKIGLFAINYGTCADPELAVRVARHAEAAGFESVWTGEHVVLPDPAPPGFTMPPTLPLLDTIVGLTLVAAHTSSIRVASGIIVLPLRNPVILAKELASVDVVAGPLDRALAEQYTELGVDRLVLLPQPDAGPAERHAPVPVDRILRNIDAVAAQIIVS